MSTSVPTGIPTTGTWNIDTVHSTASFSVAHLVVSTFRGYFSGISGSLADGVLTGEVPVDSLDVGIVPVFKEHMMAADWFDGENFKTISFKSTDLHDHDGHLHASGELTMKGVTKPVAISGTVRGPLEVTGADGSQMTRLGLDLATQINRRDFNITGGGGAGDDVILEVSLALVQA